ncbi:L,D-transpeptidase family protein [Flavobacterium sp.]|uniref:L,D-transpeptidase family protein n=1 Tax=Flavobacterium sp. TaxID=239 RepID=UPI002FDAA3E5
MKSVFALFVCVFLISCENKKTSTPVKTSLPPTEITSEGKIIGIDSISLKETKDSALMHFYFKNQMRTFWTAHNCRENVLAVIRNSKDEGLNPKDFDIKQLEKKESQLPQLSDKELIEYDFLITRNLYRYIQKTNLGTIDPKSIFKDWDIAPENKVNPIELLLNFQRKDSFDYALYKAKPQHLVYQRMIQSLKLIRQFENVSFSKLEIKDKISPQDTQDVLIEIKKRLIYWKDMKKPDTLTSVYDNSTVESIKRFQLRHGLAPDGVIGKGTIASLNINRKKREEQIIANLERWRHFPQKLEKEYLIINIPDYTLRVVLDKDTVRTHRVIVGKASRSTPILTAKLSYVVFNPTWTVPPTILKEDVIPAAQKNRAYFASKNLTIYEGNKIISASEWNPAKARSYRYVQSPGSSNSLGLVKIMFPNKFSVYLHDTNSRGYFEKENRSLSSGCVRVQNPFELTAYLLNSEAEEWNTVKIDEILATSKTKNVNLTRPIYLYLLYWTAWSEGNQLQFRDDIYNLDAKTYDSLRY